MAWRAATVWADLAVDIEQDHAWQLPRNHTEVVERRRAPPTRTRVLTWSTHFPRRDATTLRGWSTRAGLRANPAVAECSGAQWRAMVDEDGHYCSLWRYDATF